MNVSGRLWLGLPDTPRRLDNMERVVVVRSLITGRDESPDQCGVKLVFTV